MENGETKAGGAQEPASDSSTDPSAGLCDRCRWLRVQGTKRGARFYRCGRAEEDAAYLRYPPLPILRCTGFESIED